MDAALLGSSHPGDEEEGSGDTLTLQARLAASGALAELRLSPDGISIRKVEEEEPSCFPAFLAGMCQQGSALVDQIPAADIVGATVTGAELVLWHAHPHAGAPKDKPARCMRRTPALQLESAAVAAQAADHVRRTFCWAGAQQAPRLLVIVNPASGPGKGPKIYEGRIRPALDAAGCRLDMRLTQAQGHATELAKQAAPGVYAAIVAIGGDGTTHEVLQGMLGRPDWAAMAQTPFVQVPCGSGNALAASMGLWTVDTAVHAVVKAQRRQLDIATILQHSPPRRCHCFLSLNYGLITNLDIGTEHLRWMGGTRFVVGAVQQIMMKKKHTARVALLAPPDDGAAAASGAAAAAAGHAGAADAAAGDPGAGGAAAQQGLAEAAAQPGPPVQQLAAFQRLAGQQLPAGWEWLPEPEVAMFTATNLPRLDMNFHLAPDATPDSGHFNLIYTTPASRREGFELLSASERGEHMHLVKQRRLAALALEPRSTGTWLVVDGEVVPYSHLFLEVHPRLCTALCAPTSSA